jgi:hypothetical protein
VKGAHVGTGRFIRVEDTMSGKALSSKLHLIDLAGSVESHLRRTLQQRRTLQRCSVALQGRSGSAHRMRKASG